MRNIILIISLIYSGSVFAQQPDSATIKILKVAYQKLASSEEFTTPYATTAKHDTLQNKIVQLIKSKGPEAIRGVIQTEGFADFVVAKGEDWGTIKDQDLMLVILDQIMEEMPKDIENKPSEIIEDVFFGDKSRIEIWNYVDIKGKKKDFRVTFTNGQITNFMVWL